MAAIPPPPPPPPPPPSTAITVTASHDYRGETFSSIDSIVFDAADFARVMFNSSQFGPVLISDNVAITGDEHRNFIEVFLPAGGGSFSAAGWTFSNWVAPGPSSNDEVILRGSDSADTITGSSQPDGLIGGDGGDLLNGADGSDQLIGGLGVDTLIGGAGNDFYRLEDVHRFSVLPVRFLYDSVIEDPDGGIDTVSVHRVGIVGGYTLGVNIENGFVPFGTGSFSLFGNELSNSLTGNDDVNLLSGLAGSDQLFGQSGEDTLDGGKGSDLLDGGVQLDTASYASAPTGVTVSLAIVGAQATGAGVDTLINSVSSPAPPSSTSIPLAP